VSAKGLDPEQLDIGSLARSILVKLILTLVRSRYFVQFGSHKDPNIMERTGLLFTALLPFMLNAQQTVTSVANGPVLNPFVWDCLCIPADGDTIIVQHDLVMNTDWIYFSGQIRIDPTGSLVEDVPRALGVNGSASLTNFGYFKMAFLGSAVGTTVINGGTMRCETAWSSAGTVVSNGSVYGLDSLLIGGGFIANDTLQAGQVYVLPGGELSGISPVLLFNDLLVQGDMEIFGGELRIVDDALNLGDLALNNVTVLIGDDFGNLNNMTQSGTLNIGNNLYNADTTGLLTPVLNTTGFISCVDWYNGGTIMGNGRFCVQDSTVNTGVVGGTVDLCDQTPATSTPPLIDLNFGTVEAGVTFCAVGSCTVGLQETPAPDRLMLHYLNAAQLLVRSNGQPLRAIRALDASGRTVALRTNALNGGNMIHLDGMAAGVYVLIATRADGSMTFGRFIVER